MNPSLTQAFDQVREVLKYGTSQLVSKAEIQQLMRLLLEAIKQLREERMRDAEKMRQVVEKVRDELKKETPDSKTIALLRKEIIKAAAEVEAHIPLPTDLSEIEHRLHMMETKPEMKMPSMDEMKMHALMGLSIADIEGLDARLKQLERIARGGGGRLLGGVLNVGVRVEVPVGTVDGSNTSFTAYKVPKYVVSDGITYYDGQGYTYSGKALTMSVAPERYLRSHY